MAPVTRKQEEAGKNKPEDVKITLYWLEQSRAHRILWLLEELHLPYDLKTYKRQNMLAPPELKKIHPLGKSPIITISSPATPDDQPIILAESSNIIEYLLEHFGRDLVPKQWQDGKEGQVGGETEGWMRYRYFMHFGEGTLMPFLVTALLLRKMRENSPFFVRPLISLATGAAESAYVNPNLKTQMEFLESQLSSSPNNGKYICGEQLTGADILLSFPLQGAKGRAGLTKETYPKLWEYVERLEKMEAFERATKKIVEIEGAYDAKL